MIQVCIWWQAISFLNSTAPLLSKRCKRSVQSSKVWTKSLPGWLMMAQALEPPVSPSTFFLALPFSCHTRTPGVQSTSAILEHPLPWPRLSRSPPDKPVSARPPAWCDEHNVSSYSRMFVSEAPMGTKKIGACVSAFGFFSLLSFVSYITPVWKSMHMFFCC